MDGAAEFIALNAMTAKSDGSETAGPQDDVWVQGDNMVRQSPGRLPVAAFLS